MLKTNYSVGYFHTVMSVWLRDLGEEACMILENIMALFNFEDL